MPDSYKITRWRQDGPPEEAELYRLMAQAGFAPALRGEPSGSRQPVQRFHYPYMCWVLSGWIRFHFPGGSPDEPSPDVVLRAGDSLEIPAGVAHASEVEGAAYAVYLTTTPLTLPLAPALPNVNV